jgi:SAM-dependent methyltransferase
MSWRDFWNGEHAIYVSGRHKALHYRRIAQDIAAAVPSRDASVLDVGCGEALSADLVAAASGKLILCEAAPTVREKLRARFGALANLSVVSPEEVEALADDSLDLVVANSLIQYLSEDELKRALAIWLTKLKPGGELILADVIPPDLSALTDATELLGFAWRGGFFVAALGGLVPYRLLGLPQAARPIRAVDLQRGRHLRADRGCRIQGRHTPYQFRP